jgi:hypothetical protein
VLSYDAENLRLLAKLGGVLEVDEEDGCVEQWLLSHAVLVRVSRSYASYS